jgi:hypothetical protein
MIFLKRQNLKILGIRSTNFVWNTGHCCRDLTECQEIYFTMLFVLFQVQLTLPQICICSTVISRTMNFVKQKSCGVHVCRLPWCGMQCCVVWFSRQYVFRNVTLFRPHVVTHQKPQSYYYSLKLVCDNGSSNCHSFVPLMSLILVVN